MAALAVLAVSFCTSKSSKLRNQARGVRINSVLFMAAFAVLVVFGTVQVDVVNRALVAGSSLLLQLEAALLQLCCRWTLSTARLLQVSA